MQKIRRGTEGDPKRWMNDEPIAMVNAEFLQS